jgi:hypothetical protein
MSASVTTRLLSALGAIAALAFAGLSPAAAGSQFLEYAVKHPTFGDIGTYSNLIETTAEGTVVTSRLDVTVKLVGLVAHREQSLRRERWQHGRLLAFSSTTEKNGQRSELRGEARDGGFVVVTPTGTVAAPAEVRPSNPWSAELLQSGPLFSTRDGSLLSARVSLGAEETVLRGGQPERLRRFDIDSDKREHVWVDSQNVPVAFRTQEQGTPIDFVLIRQETLPSRQTAEVPPAFGR